MKASLETSALFLSTTLELKNFVSHEVKFHCFLLPNLQSKDSSRSFSDLETTGPFQSMFISASKADCFAFLSDFICFWSIDPILSMKYFSINFPGYPENFPDHQKNIKSIRKLSRLSKNLTDHPENIQIIQKLSRLSRNFLDYPETILTTRNFSGYPKTEQTIRKISRLSRNFPAYPETFQAIRKFSGSSGKYPDYPETFQTIWKLS